MDREIQAILSGVQENDDKLAALSRSYSRENVREIQGTLFDRRLLASRRLLYERLDQLVIDLLLGVR